MYYIWNWFKKINMLGDHMVEKRNLAGNGQEKIRENGFKISLRSSDQC